jgi:hypothetical protein
VATDPLFPKSQYPSPLGVGTMATVAGRLAALLGEPRNSAAPNWYTAPVVLASQ